ncbi:MAG: glycogen/starch synthase [Clostridia bacterium]|nr:glycogen/starch synthase [Clostridia bacterium]
MRILFVTSECAPFSKSGGLADVAFSLPPALARAGDDLAILTPLYQCVWQRFQDQLTFVMDVDIDHGGETYRCELYQGDRGGVPIWFLKYDPFFNRPRLYGYEDDKLRFAFFSRAVIALLPELGPMPDILHCNDWETALSVIYLKNDQVTRPELKSISSVFTIHNIAYQGQFSAWEMQTTFDLPEGWYDGGLGFEYEGRHDVNLMKGAMMMADAVTTVSPTYARELHHHRYGMGLEGVAHLVDNKLQGILNGIDMDHYDPKLDPRLPASFDEDHMEGKDVCKAELQKIFGLETESRFPLFSLVARLVEQKGVELIKALLPRLMDLGCQLIIFGQGDQEYVDYFTECIERWPGQFGFSDNYSEDMAAKVFAGSDFYLMPSRFEPCGLSQMMAMRYGTVPIVHETGGLKDSVRAYSEFDGVGDGFSFPEYTGQSLMMSIMAALRVYFCDEETFKLLRRRCMEKDFSWERSAQQYQRMYSRIAVDSTVEQIPYRDAYLQLKDAYVELERANREQNLQSFPDPYHRVIQVHMTTQTDGFFFLQFDRQGDRFTFRIEPFTFHDADAFISVSFDHLMAMARGETTFDRLYLSGLLRVKGNLSKGAEMRVLLGRRKGKEG